MKKHITSILGKLCLENRVEAVLFASRNLPEITERQSGQETERRTCL